MQRSRYHNFPLLFQELLNIHQDNPERQGRTALLQINKDVHIIFRAGIASSHQTKYPYPASATQTSNPFDLCAMHI